MLRLMKREGGRANLEGWPASTLSRNGRSMSPHMHTLTSPVSWMNAHLCARLNFEAILAAVLSCILTSFESAISDAPTTDSSVFLWPTISDAFGEIH